jgi:hypothetical protein
LPVDAILSPPNNHRTAETSKQNQESEQIEE